MNIVLKIDEKTPLKDGDLLIFENGKVKSLKRSALLRDVFAENKKLKDEIAVLKNKINNLTKVVKEIIK